MNAIQMINSDIHTNPQIIRELMRIEDAVYEEEYRGAFDSIKARFEKFPEMFILAYDGDELIGYFCWFPITKHLHDRIVSDEALFDDDICPEDVTGFGEENYIYIISAAIMPAYQNHDLGTEMMKRFMEILKHQKAEGRNTRDVLTSVVSLKGEKLVQKHGFDMVADRKESGYKLYKLDGDRL